MLANVGAAGAKVAAVVQLYVKCDDADLARIVTIDATSSVVDGEDADADVVVAVAAKALVPFLTGALDMERALADGDVEVEGDVAVLARIADLFDGGASPMATRLAAMTRTTT